MDLKRTHRALREYDIALSGYNDLIQGDPTDEEMDEAEDAMRLWLDRAREWYADETSDRNPDRVGTVVLLKGQWDGGVQFLHRMVATWLKSQEEE